MRVRVFRLFGRGIDYSASPPMMQAAFRALGLGHRYELRDVESEQLHEALSELRRPEFGGANVTAPHKVAAASLVDELSADAAVVGAVNTIVPLDGGLRGENTDLPALVETITDLLAGRPRHAVVLGGGGASRAVTVALTAAGASQTSVVSRSGNGPGWEDVPRLLGDADLLINATPVGTRDDRSPVPRELLRPTLAVLDLVYRPSPTRLVSEARAAGAAAVAGAGVLLGQGWRSVELWLGVPAPVDAMRRALRDELGEGADV